MKKTLTLFATAFFIFTVSAQEDTNAGEKSTKSTYSEANESEYTVSDVERLENLVSRNDEKIENLFFKEEEVMGYAGTTKIAIVKIKNKIYEAGQTLIEAQKAANPQKTGQKVQNLEEILRIQERMLFLVRQEKTRKLEKSLKKLDTPEQIAPVFFGDF